MLGKLTGKLQKTAPFLLGNTMGKTLFWDKDDNPRNWTIWDYDEN
jgi:hypothetical protein